VKNDDPKNSQFINVYNCLISYWYEYTKRHSKDLNKLLDAIRFILALYCPQHTANSILIFVRESKTNLNKSTHILLKQSKCRTSYQGQQEHNVKQRKC